MSSYLRFTLLAASHSSAAAAHQGVASCTSRGECLMANVAHSLQDCVYRVSCNPCRFTPQLEASAVKHESRQIAKLGEIVAT
mmetsp:Transcript_8072/g.18029  ORF Transcript_8072/g.18029 Transcript_8072/m.18029 type:complete len:82 (+) Transcript_8072:1-246(+)